MTISKKKITKLSIIVSLFLILMQLTSVCKATNEIDVSPPWARLSVVGATESGGTNYVTSTEVKIQIYAHDDKCADTEIQYYISKDAPIDNKNPLDENLWQTYESGLTIDYTLPSLTATNKLYAIFRDKSGNTSLIYEGPNVEYTIKYDANGGTGTIADGTAYHGMAYIVTNQYPTREDYYFIGWSLDPQANTATYEQGDIIPATHFNSDQHTITLYAVWSANKADLALLADKVSIGDYVNYPVYYENVYANGTISSRTGWRVISKNVDLNGNTSEGTVNLVSAGCPLTYYHVAPAADSVEALTTNFLTTEFDEYVTKRKFVKNGFIGYTNLKDVFTNIYTATDGENNPLVRSMIARDILDTTGQLEMETGYEMDLNNPKYSGLYKNDVTYWLASAHDTISLWYVLSDGYVTYYYSIEYGVRPVVSLKSNVKTSAMDTQGRWIIEIE